MTQKRNQAAAITIPAPVHQPTDAEWTDPDHPRNRDALTRSCDQCGAKPGALCVRRGGLRDDLKGRLVHIGRKAPR